MPCRSLPATNEPCLPWARCNSAPAKPQRPLSPWKKPSLRTAPDGALIFSSLPPTPREAACPTRKRTRNAPSTWPTKKAPARVSFLEESSRQRENCPRPNAPGRILPPSFPATHPQRKPGRNLLLSPLHGLSSLLSRLHSPVFRSPFLPASNCCRPPNGPGLPRILTAANTRWHRTPRAG